MEICNKRARLKTTILLPNIDHGFHARHRIQVGRQHTKSVRAKGHTAIPDFCTVQLHVLQHLWAAACKSYGMCGVRTFNQPTLSHVTSNRPPTSSQECYLLGQGMPIVHWTLTLNAVKPNLISHLRHVKLVSGRRPFICVSKLQTTSLHA